jgi:hypothetical protein
VSQKILVQLKTNAIHLQKISSKNKFFLWRLVNGPYSSIKIDINLISFSLAKVLIGHGDFDLQV